MLLTTIRRVSLSRRKQSLTPYSTNMEYKEIKRKSISSKSDKTKGGSGLVSRTNFGYGDFLKRPV